jgi:hypothetical protein
MRVIRARDEEAICDETLESTSPITLFFIRIIINYFDIPTVPCTCGKCKPGSQTITQEEIDAITGRAIELLPQYHPKLEDREK